MTKTITDRFGHKIRVVEWPSEKGLATIRRHYKRYHPKAFRQSIRKGLRTKLKRGVIQHAPALWK